MTTIVDLKFPQLSYVDENNKHHLQLNDSITSLNVGVDGVFNSVSVGALKSQQDVLTDNTQKITSDGASTFITGPLVCDSDINVQGEVFNVNAETKISDHFLVESDGGSTSSVVIKNSNNTAPPLVIQHNSTDIFSLSTDGTITNSNIQLIESNLTQEITDRQTAVSNETTSRQNADTTLQTNIDNLQTSVTNTTSSLQSEIDVVEEKTQNIVADEDETTFDSLTQVKWNTGEEYFCIKSRSSLSVVSSTTAEKVLDFKNHQYSVNGSDTGVYELCLMSSDATSNTPFFNAKLVKYSDSSVMYPLASYKVSATYTHSTNTLTFTFDESISKDFVVSWQLVN